MSVKITGTRLPVPLSDGDTIEIGMSHEIKVDGDGTWVSMKVTSRVGVGETPDDAYQRVEEFLIRKIRQTVKDTVANIEEMTK